MSKTYLKFVILILALYLFGASMMAVGSGGWRTADRSSAGLAPAPDEFREAVVQVYAARAYSWRGTFAVHTWISTKQKDADTYMVHQVLGWRKRRNLPVVSSKEDLPDRIWFNKRPQLLVDIRGAKAEPVIESILEAVSSYPHHNDYAMWPGPNSNTFTAYIGRQVPALKLNLPSTAIGKDFLTNYKIIGKSPSGTGYQLSLYGLLGVMLSSEEGLEVNVLGLSFGINPLKLNIKLPVIGTIGPQ